MAAAARIAIEDEDGVPVARFLDRQVGDDNALRSVDEQLTAAATSGGGFRLIVDFGALTLASSAFIARMVMLQRRADLVGGTLRICGLTPAIREVFRVTNLDRVVKICRDRNEAREAFGRS